MKLSQFFLLTTLFQKLVIATATDVYNGCPTLDFTWHTNQQNIINYSMDITDINQIQDNLFNITIHVTGSQQIPLKYLYSLKVIGIDGPNNYVQLYGENEHTYLIDNPTDFSVSFEVYATLTGCKYWMPNFQIQFEYLQGNAAQYWETWTWGTSTFDLISGCDNYDNQGHSQTDFPGFYWNVGLPPECIVDRDPIGNLGTTTIDEAITSTLITTEDTPNAVGTTTIDEIITSTLITTEDNPDTVGTTTYITQSLDSDPSSAIDAGYRSRAKVSGVSGVIDSIVESTGSSQMTHAGEPVTTTVLITTTVIVTDIVESDTTFTKLDSTSTTSSVASCSQESSDNAASESETPTTITFSTTTTYPPYSRNPGDNRLGSVPTGWPSGWVVSTTRDENVESTEDITFMATTTQASSSVNTVLESETPSTTTFSTTTTYPPYSRNPGANRLGSVPTGWPSGWVFSTTSDENTESTEDTTFMTSTIQSSSVEIQNSQVIMTTDQVRSSVESQDTQVVTTSINTVIISGLSLTNIQTPVVNSDTVQEKSTVSDPGKEQLNSLTIISQSVIVTPTPQADLPSTVSSGLSFSTETVVSSVLTSSDSTSQSSSSSQLTGTTSSVFEPSGANTDISSNSNPTDNTASATNSQTVQSTILTTPVATTVTETSITCSNDICQSKLVTKVVSTVVTEETTSSSSMSFTSGSIVCSVCVTDTATTTEEFDYPSSSSISESRSISVPQDNSPSTGTQFVNTVSTTSTSVSKSIGYSMNSYSSHTTESDSGGTSIPVITTTESGTSIPVIPTTESGTSINSESTHVSFTSGRVTTTVSPTSHTTILIAPQTSTSSIPQVHMFENSASRSIGVFNWLASAIFVLQFV
ncbi:Flo11 protein [Maudiozyma humilis]|uniref:Flo11 protein n=1 Tax=Maudiozyma humilis TaxID=51915 RepID=A0AAV5RWQ3_MAUHU|nr:Flo11 protein [Kazachstania humilis]